MTRALLTALTLSLSAALPAAVAAQDDAPAGSAEAIGEAVDAVAEDMAAGLAILPAEGFDPASYLWTRRILAVFADTPADPRFIQQMDLLNKFPRDLLDRDVIVVVDSDPAAGSAIRKKLRPRGFALVLIDKDGVVKLRKPSPWSTREIARTIDKTPLRRDEVLDRAGGAG